MALLGSGQFDLSEVEIRNLLSSFQIDSDGLVNYYDWLSALIDWKQVCSVQRLRGAEGRGRRRGGSEGGGCWEEGKGRRGWLGGREGEEEGNGRTR